MNIIQMQNWSKFIQMQKQLINRVLIVDEAVSTQNIPFYFRERIIRNSDSLFAVNTEEIIKNIGNILEIELE